MDYFSTLAYDPQFLQVVVGGGWPFVIFGDLKWAALWLVVCVLSYPYWDTWSPEVWLVLVLAPYISKQFIGMLSMLSTKVGDEE